jgi:hypothetical protein
MCSLGFILSPETLAVMSRRMEGYVTGGGMTV